MHIKKYDFDFSRRHFMVQTARGAASAGVLSSLWPEICRSAETTRVYPDELLNIETFTKGRVKPGDVIDADSIDLVQDLVDPILYQEVKQDRRKFVIQTAETQVEAMYPPYFFDATMKNQGQASFDTNGNVYLTGKGVSVYDAEGEKIQQIDVPENWSANVCFGGQERDTLFITASDSLYSIQMQTKGLK